MQNFSIVKSFETSNYLYKNIPDFFLLYVGLSFLIIANLLKNVPIVGVFHHEAKLLDKVNYTYHKELLVSSMNASLYNITFGLFNEANILTSFRAFSFSFSDKFSILTFFSA